MLSIVGTDQLLGYIYNFPKYRTIDNLVHYFSAKKKWVYCYWFYETIEKEQRRNNTVQ